MERRGRGRQRRGAVKQVERGLVEDAVARAGLDALFEDIAARIHAEPDIYDALLAARPGGMRVALVLQEPGLQQAGILDLAFLHAIWNAERCCRGCAFLSRGLGSRS